MKDTLVSKFCFTSKLPYMHIIYGLAMAWFVVMSITRVRENIHLPLWRAPAIKKKPPFSNARALITREIMRSKDAQYHTKEGLNSYKASTIVIVMLVFF